MNFEIEGIVVKGKGRGAKLGFPTINLLCPKLELEKYPEGVWTAFVKVGKKKFPSLAFWGRARTFGEKEKRIEVYILNFNRRLYGRKVKVFFLKKVRGNKKFKTKKALILQMKKDEIGAIEFFKNVHGNNKKHRKS